jgi:tetratricopeptide (TPR) repeat protein
MKGSRAMREVARPLALLALALALPLAAPQARAQARPKALYVVVLATADSSAKRPPGAIPAPLRENALYWRQVGKGAAPSYQLCLGFFESRSEAERAQRQLTRSFRGAQVIAVSPLERDNLLQAQQPKPPPAAPPPASAAEPAPAGGPEQLMAEGRGAITREDYGAAIRAFTALLALPGNSLSRDAQEFLALSYERAGDPARARAEYESYLKRYPEGEDSVRVQQRLANLQPAPPPQALRAPAPGGRGPRKMVYGSVSQFYYRGNSKIDTETQLPATSTVDRATLSFTDQSTLYTNVDLNGRFLDETHDNRIVFRDANMQNFLQGQSDRNRVYAAYYEYRYKPADFSARVGRQPGSSSGLLGRFDGALVGYGIAPKTRLNVVAGQPVDYGFSIDSTRRLFGVNAELGPFAQRWSGNLYAIRQTVDGITDRQAVGTEARYAGPQGGVFAVLDYDTSFRHTNIATLQANWLAPSRTAFNLMLDYRMSPALQTSTALVGEQTTSIRTLLETYTEDELRGRARALTARTAYASAGVTHPVSKAWQLGADMRVSRISHTDGTNNVPGTPGSGYIYAPSVQAIGTGLLAKRDVTAFSITRTRADAYTGTTYAANNRTPLGDRWLVGGALLLYAQDNANDTTLKRVYGSLRSEYRVRASVSLEAEIGTEQTTSKGALVKETYNRNFFSLGYRWDF